MGERSHASHEGEWFDALETSLDRHVSVLVTGLPADEAEASTLEERARRIASITDARLLPVYGQGAEGGFLWIATRKFAGRSLSAVSSLEPSRAARLGAQLARQLTALEAAGISPQEITDSDVIVEGSGEQESAWLLPNLHRPISSDAGAATSSLLALLEKRARHPLLPNAPSDPQTLADGLESLAAAPRQRNRPLVAGAGLVVLAAVAALVAVLLTRGGSSAADPNAPVASVTAQIALGATVNGLAADAQGIWAATPEGKLVRVDPTTNSVVGAARPLFPENAYVDLAPDGSSVWIGGPGKIVRLDASSGRLLETKNLGKRVVSGLLIADGALYATLNEGPSPIGRLVRFKRGSSQMVMLSRPFGVFAIPVLWRHDTGWALGGDAGFTRLAADKSVSTIGLATQAGFPAVSDGRVWIPTRIERTLVVVNPTLMKPVGVLHLAAEPQRAVSGAGSIWVLTQNPSRIYRIDPATLRLLGKPVPAPVGASFIKFGAGSLWVDDPKAQTLVRLEPTTPPPGAQPAEPTSDILENGPVPKGVRLRVTSVKPPFSIAAPDDDWIAEAVTTGGVQLESLRNHGHGLSVSTPTQAFDRAGRLVPVRSPADLVAVLRQNPNLQVGKSAPVSLHGLAGLRVRVMSDPKPPIPQLCGPTPCAVIFPLSRGTYILSKGTLDELTIVQHGTTLFFIDAALAEPRDPTLERRIHALEATMQFDS